MSDGTPVRGIVVAHGLMARGMVDAVRRIAGSAADALEPLSNDGLGATQLREALSEMVGSGPVVIFTDLQAGSCGLAAFASCRDAADRAVVCGVNLPVLLDFVFHRDLPMDELVSRLVEKGRAGIRPVPERKETASG